MTSMTQPLSTRRTGAAPAAAEVADFVRKDWLNDCPQPTPSQISTYDHQLQSIERIVALAATTYANVYRDNRAIDAPNAESTFWHKWRVGNSVYRHTRNKRNNLLETFAAVAHDLVEDTRKLPPEQQISIRKIANLWSHEDVRKEKNERALITQVLTLKTDAVGLMGDKRRYAQMMRVKEVGEGRHGIAGKIFQRIMLWDKYDNLNSDLQDARAGCLRFDSRAAALEYINKKNGDLAIVSQMQINPKLATGFYRAFQALNEELLTRGHGKPTLIGDTVAHRRQKEKETGDGAVVKVNGASAKATRVGIATKVPNVEPQAPEETPRSIGILLPQPTRG